MLIITTIVCFRFFSKNTYLVFFLARFYLKNIYAYGELILIVNHR